jgi:hypothetical protein
MLLRRRNTRPQQEEREQQIDGAERQQAEVGRPPAARQHAQRRDRERAGQAEVDQEKPDQPEHREACMAGIGDHGDHAITWVRGLTARCGAPSRFFSTREISERVGGY